MSKASVPPSNRDKDKDPNRAILAGLINSQLVKNVKKMKEKKRDALLDRYYLKCARAQSERFFQWREKFKKLKLVHRIVVLSNI
jgi:hypothetical protein